MCNYTIYITYHQDKQIETYNLKEDEAHILFPVHREANGDNLNYLNKIWGEITTLYYVWCNQIRNDYVGFCHYRRNLNIKRLPNPNEIQIYQLISLDTTIYKHYAECHNINDLNIIIEILSNKYGEFNKYNKYILNEKQLIANCCFLCDWQTFNNICGFLFPIIFEYMTQMNCATLEDWRNKTINDFHGKNTDYQMRVVGFLAERLISAYIFTNYKYYF